MRSRRVLFILGAVVLFGGWYAFRPERLFIHTTVSESFPGGDAAEASSMAPAVLAEGRFHAGAHETSGAATIHELAGGKRVLRLTGFITSNGPDVHVYLVAAPDATDNDTVTRAGFVDLGSIKGTIGDQNYELPGALDLARYRAVTVWCKRFGVNFATAPLS